MFPAPHFEGGYIDLELSEAVRHAAARGAHVCVTRPTLSCRGCRFYPNQGAFKALARHRQWRAAPPSETMRPDRRLIMQLHGTDNAQNTHPSTGPRFLRRTIRVALAAGLVAIAGLGLSGTLVASNDDGPRGCTVATLKGRYLFAFSTTLLPPAFGVTQPTPSHAAGFNILNGDGTGTDTVTLSIGGHVVLENAVVPTSY